MTVAFALAMLGSAAPAQALSCKALSRLVDQNNAMDDAADRASEREDYKTACKLHNRYAALIEEALKKTDASCFHGPYGTATLAIGAMAETARSMAETECQLEKVNEVQ